MTVWVMGFVKFRAFSFAGLAAFAELCLNRKPSFPVSKMWRRVSETVEQRGRHLGVAEHGGHSPKLRFIVMMTLARS
jgi:hypothetical protein